ncbi:MAG: co-chaperone GroES [Planctomycetota bacterium]
MTKTKTSTSTATKIVPLGDKILVKRSDADEVTKGGIILPDTAKEKPKEGTVIAVGQGRALENGERAPFTVKPKDRVLFSSYAGSEIQLDGEDFLILGEDEILAIIQ